MIEFQVNIIIHLKILNFVLFRTAPKFFTLNENLQKVFLSPLSIKFLGIFSLSIITIVFFNLLNLPLKFLLEEEIWKC